ncbi:MAG: hypothetical protein ACYCX2_02880 [Christensenellales bacterium]
MRTNDRSNLAYKYEYQYGQTATQPRRDWAQEEQRRKKLQEQRRRRAEELAKKLQLHKKRQQVKLKVMSVLLAVAVSVLFGGVIWRYAAISETNSKINTLKKELESQTNKISELDMEYTMAQKLDTIRDKAKALGMDFPESSQIIYFDMDAQAAPAED